MVKKLVFDDGPDNQMTRLLESALSSADRAEEPTAPTPLDHAAFLLARLHEMGIVGDDGSDFSDLSYADLLEGAVYGITGLLMFAHAVDGEEAVPVLLSRVLNDFVLVNREMRRL